MVLPARGGGGTGVRRSGVSPSRGSTPARRRGMPVPAPARGRAFTSCLPLSLMAGPHMLRGLLSILEPNRLLLAIVSEPASDSCAGPRDALPACRATARYSTKCAIGGQWAPDEDSISRVAVASGRPVGARGSQGSAKFRKNEKNAELGTRLHCDEPEELPLRWPSAIRVDETAYPQRCRKCFR